MQDAQNLKEKILKLTNLQMKIDVSLAKSKGIKVKEKRIDKFTIEELEDALQKLEIHPKGRKTIRDFLNYLMSKRDSIFKSKIKYVNVKFKAENLSRLNQYIRTNKNIKSFRNFIISKLCEEFKIDLPKTFAINSKKEIKSAQILIPDYIINEIKHKIAKKNKKIEDKDVIKIVRRKIESIIKDIQ